MISVTTSLPPNKPRLKGTTPQENENFAPIKNSTEKTTDLETPSQDSTPNIYQAMGWLCGRVEKSSEGILVVKLKDGYTFPLTANPQILHQLYKYYVADEPGINKPVWLKCYPNFKLQTGELYFQVFWHGVKPLEEKAVSGLFVLRGIWQFIPQQKRPVFSIYRNDKRNETDKLKTAHLPLIWKEEKPFFFKKDSEVRPQYYQIEARLIPKLGCFGWVRSLAEPCKPPRKVKLKKELPPDANKESAKKKPSESNDDTAGIIFQEELEGANSEIQEVGDAGGFPGISSGGDGRTGSPISAPRADRSAQTNQKHIQEDSAREQDGIHDFAAPTLHERILAEMGVNPDCFVGDYRHLVNPLERSTSKKELPPDANKQSSKKNPSELTFDNAGITSQEELEGNNSEFKPVQTNQKHIQEDDDVTIPGKLEVTIKINQLPDDVQDTENSWKTFEVDCDGQVVRITVKPKIFKKLEEAHSNYPLWVATITGKMGAGTKDRFELESPAISVFERKPRET